VRRAVSSDAGKLVDAGAALLVLLLRPPDEEEQPAEHDHDRGADPDPGPMFPKMTMPRTPRNRMRIAAPASFRA